MDNNTRPQFVYDADDLHPDLNVGTDEMSAMIAALIAIESEHPGTIRHCLRIAALSNGNFCFTSSCSNSEASMSAQLELIDWMSWFIDQKNLTSTI